MVATLPVLLDDGVPAGRGGAALTGWSPASSEQRRGLHDASARAGLFRLGAWEWPWDAWDWGRSRFWRSAGLRSGGPPHGPARRGRGSDIIRRMALQGRCVKSSRCLKFGRSRHFCAGLACAPRLEAVRERQPGHPGSDAVGDAPPGHVPWQPY